MTASGAARLSSAMCILDFFEAADDYIPYNAAKKESYGDVRDEERVKETNYAKLYAEKFGQIKDEKNRHRRAAAYAQESMKAAEQGTGQKIEQSDIKL